MELRNALVSDLEALESLDALCFPVGGADAEPAGAGELEAGVRAGRVVVAVDPLSGHLLGFMHYELPNADHAYLNAVAVRPDCRRRGIGRRLVLHFLETTRRLSRKRSVSVAAGLGNVPVLALLLSAGFVGRTVMHDYYGPGRDRLYFMFKVRSKFLDPDRRFVVPLTARRHLEELLSGSDYVVTDLVTLPSGWAFEVGCFDDGDFALESNETAAGINFSGLILASISVVLAFSLASAQYPDAVRVLLLGAVLVTTVSLVIYTNTTGEIARLRSRPFVDHMAWGNVLSEFGGVYPFLISLPVTFVSVSQSRAAAWVVAVTFAVGLSLYSASQFALARRFKPSGLTRLLTILLCTSPVTATACLPSEWAMWGWTAMVTAALILLAWVFLYRRPGETAEVPPAVYRRVRG